MRRAAIALALAWLTGCAPELGDEYLCTGGGPCPEGFTCWGDGVCRRGDGGAPRYADCDRDDQCDSRACAPSTDSTVGTAGAYCSTPCSEDSDCVAEGEEPPARCIGDFCRPRCDETRDCEMGIQCWVPFDPGDPPMPEPVCLNVRADVFERPPACSGPRECEVPGLCSSPMGTDTGVCAMAFLGPRPAMMGGMPPMGTECPGNTECVDMYNDAGLCLLPCEPGVTECGEGTVCSELTVNGTPASYCTGPDWADLSVPVSQDLRMSLPMPMGMMTP